MQGPPTRSSILSHGPKACLSQLFLYLTMCTLRCKQQIHFSAKNDSEDRTLAYNTTVLQVQCVCAHARAQLFYIMTVRDKVE